MIHANKSDAETSDHHNFAARYRTQVFALDAVFFKPTRQNSERELCAVNGNGQFLQDVRQRSDVVFVSVSEDNRLQALFIFDDVGNIGYNQVDAEHIVFGEHKPRVNHNHFVAVADNGHVLADFTEPAQRNNF